MEQKTVKTKEAEHTVLSRQKQIVKKVAFVVLAVGFLLVVVSIAWFAAAFSNYRPSGNIGIIGGADGPTLKLVLKLLFPEISKTFPFRLGVFGTMMMLAGAVVALVKRKAND